MNIHIGTTIREEVERQGLTADQFAGLISTSRTNVYHIYNRDNIDMELLTRISTALHRNFFAEMYSEMAAMLGAATPPPSWANMKLQTLTNPLRREMGGHLLDIGEFTKDRKHLKDVLSEYFESDYRMPLLILESGYTFGAREVVTQVAAEVFRERGAATCPKRLEVARLRAMTEKVLVDYIDKNTFGTLTDCDRRISDLCRVQPDTTKRIVCIIHTDPALFGTRMREAPTFEHWGSLRHIMLTRYEQCFIVAYRWGTPSLLSWAEDTHCHAYLSHYIRHHRVDPKSMDYALTHLTTSYSMTLFGGPAVWESVDSRYPTSHARCIGEWTYVSDFFSEQRDIEGELMMREWIEEIRDFNQQPEESPLADSGDDEAEEWDVDGVDDLLDWFENETDQP